ncbi:MAG: dTDP-4-amino-4,6-dideoxygalactose transaminase [Planctomycetes bacterium]|nr:dTDP-4-amino-4,6-dideoxygalactose transaminase [Planctomycetota bacterium]
MNIPFNKPFMTGKELEYIARAHADKHLSGDGTFTSKCQTWLEKRIGCCKALLTHSCTAALEMSAILSDIEPGDEVIMPSFTFVSTANAFVLRGAVPVFVDIRNDTLNIDESKIESAITKKTKAIVPVHYAGISCDMHTIMAIADKHNLVVIEDAAQGIMSFYRDRPVGSIGQLACLSFHETKNVISGEGGAILINEPQFVERSEIIREKGTNRKKFFRGQTDKYTWVDIGSSYLPSEIIAAFLWAQLEQADSITRRRMEIWNQYHEVFVDLEKQGKVRRPIVPAECVFNAHMYYLLLPDLKRRKRFLNHMSQNDILSVFHYVPLHLSPAGRKYGRTHGDLSWTEQVGDRVVRLPLWIEMDQEIISRVIREVIRAVDVI